MILQTIPEGIGLGILLILVCAIGIRKGEVGMTVIARSYPRCVGGRHR